MKTARTVATATRTKRANQARLARAGFAAAALAVVAACNGDRSASSYGVDGEIIHLQGIGATVPRALFAKWAQQYAYVDARTTLDYVASGSGAGVQAGITGANDFGVSDEPLSDADAHAHPEVRHIPLAVEAIAVVYNVKDVKDAPQGRLQITEDALADVLEGRIRFWDDSILASINAPAKLPHTPIRVVYRVDESGSSQVLSDWLTTTTSRWTRGIGRTWTLPVGTGAQKDDGMIARVQENDGTLGYVSSVAARERSLSTFAIRNAAGRFVAPTLEGMRAAATSARLGDDLRARAIAAPGDLSYPLCSFAFTLVHADGKDAPRRRALARFLWWATHDGQRFGPALGFGGLPGELSARDEGALRSLLANGDPILP